jgi:hypothetical protein
MVTFSTAESMPVRMMKCAKGDNNSMRAHILSPLYQTPLSGGILDPAYLQAKSIRFAMGRHCGSSGCDSGPRSV